MDLVRGGYGVGMGWVRDWVRDWVRMGYFVILKKHLKTDGLFCNFKKTLKTDGYGVGTGLDTSLAKSEGAPSMQPDFPSATKFFFKFVAIVFFQNDRTGGHPTTCSL